MISNCQEFVKKKFRKFAYFRHKPPFFADKCPFFAPNRLNFPPNPHKIIQNPPIAQYKFLTPATTLHFQPRQNNRFQITPRQSTFISTFSQRFGLDAEIQYWRSNMFMKNIGPLPTLEQIVSITSKAQVVTLRMINTPIFALRIRLQSCRDARCLAELIALLIHVNRTRVASCDQITIIKTAEQYLSPYFKLRLDDLQYEHQSIGPPLINFSTIRMATDDNISINTRYVRQVSRDRCTVTIHIEENLCKFRCEFRSVADASRFVGYVNWIKAVETPTQAQLKALINDERDLRYYLRPRNEEVILKEVRELLCRNRRARKITDHFLSVIEPRNCQELVWKR